MIEYSTIELNELSDYDKIIELLPNAFHRNPYETNWINELKNRVGLRCSYLIVEYPYYDSEYLSSFYRYYAKKFRDFKKESARVHFCVANGEYMGYITIVPTVHYPNLGKSYLSPKILLSENAFVILTQFYAHIYGGVHEVNSFPWMNQQRDFSMCAHVALWTILKFYGNKHSEYKDITIGEIIDGIPEQTNRKLPAHGLSLQQMAEVFRKYDLNPLIVKKDPNQSHAFYRELICYTESGIPVVAISDKNDHAFSVIGHGSIDYNILDSKTGIVDSCECISSIVVNDDNKLPYYIVHKDNQEGYPYSIEDIDYILIPLYNRVHQEFAVFYELVKSYLATGNLDISKDSVIKTYMVSSNLLKKVTVESSMNDNLKDIILRLEMPKLVWCVETSSYDEYKNGKVSGKIIIDTTASPGDKSPWLLTHDRTSIQYFSNGKWYKISENIEPYEIYQFNLKGVKI